MITCSIITVSAYSEETLQEKKNLKHLVSLSDTRRDGGRME